jgi:hypothetical protein
MSDTATYNLRTEKPGVAASSIDFSRHPCFSREAHNKFGASISRWRRGATSNAIFAIGSSIA